MNNPVERRWMARDECEALDCLKQVTFPAASWDKRFAHSLFGNETITEKEAPQLWRLFIRYRRQIQCPTKAKLLAMAESLAAPDFRKQQAAERAQGIIDEMKKKYSDAMQNKVLDTAPNP